MADGGTRHEPVAHDDRDQLRRGFQQLAHAVQQQLVDEQCGGIRLVEDDVGGAEFDILQQFPGVGDTPQLEVDGAGGTPQVDSVGPLDVEADKDVEVLDYRKGNHRFWSR